jgi:hypothetical protein
MLPVVRARAFRENAAVSRSPPEERRRYVRVPAPILVRPAGAVSAGRVARRVADIGSGGLRAYSDEDLDAGARVEIELFFPEGAPAVVLVEVAWVQELPAGSPARFDVGLRFLQIASEDLARIQALVAMGPG